MSEIVKSKGLLSIAVLGSGNVIGTVISAIAIILFSRFMGPSEFGLFSAAIAAMQIVVRLTDMGTNMATERALARAYGRDQRLADRLVRVGFWLKIVTFILVSSAGWVLAPWISLSLLHIENIAIIRTALLISAGTIFFEYTTILFQSSHRFAMVARITIAQAIGKLGFGLLLIWQGALTGMTALLVYGLMPGIGALLGWFKSPLSSVSLPSTWSKDLKTILSVAKWTGIAAVSATLADNIDTLMVQSFMTSYDTGIWSGAARIAAFGSIVGWSIGSVLSNRVARYKDPQHLRVYMSKAWKISILSLVVLCLAIPLAKISIMLTIGSAYLPAIVPLQILLVSAGLAAAASPYSALFYLFDRPEYYAIAGIISTVALLAGDYFLIPLYGLNGAAYVRVGVKILVLLFTIIYSKFAYEKHLHTH
jgi:O-antigen/teichoic acid export membrane protein